MNESNPAAGMCFALIVTGIVACFVMGGCPIPLIVCAAVAYSVWHVGKGLGG